MTPATKHLIDMFEERKKQNQDQLDRVERMPGFRMVQHSSSGEIDKTEQYKHDLRRGIDEWQRAINYLLQHDP